MGISIDIRHKAGSFCLETRWELEENRIGLFGPSGCGKSMTLKSIAGIVTPLEGKIQVNGQVLFDSRKKINRKPQERRVGYLFQNYALFPNMTVRKNVEMGLCGRREQLSRREIHEAADQLLERFQIKDLEKKFPGTLSGGEKQRTALARIMAYEPQTILLDEPFSAMDRKLKEQLYEEMDEFLKEYKGTTVLVSHDYEEICHFCRKIISMKQPHAT